MSPVAPLRIPPPLVAVVAAVAAVAVVATLPVLTAVLVTAVRPGHWKTKAHGFPLLEFRAGFSGAHKNKAKPDESTQS
jgi:hypothetical protein